MAVRHPEPSIHTYRHAHADNRAFEKIAQPVPHLPSIMPSQLPFHSSGSSWDIPSETGFVWDAPNDGSNLERPASNSSNSTIYDNGGIEHGDYSLGCEISAPAGGYNAQVLVHPLGLPISLSQPLDGRGTTSDGRFPRFKTYGTIYTDDVRMKLGDAIRRQCFNCRATQTTTWRRSTLSTGKLLCNKCGLFERTHGTARPKEFPRKRRSRPASGRSSITPPLPNGQGYCHYNGRPSDISFISRVPNAFGSMDGEAPQQDTSWMTQMVPQVSPIPSHFSPCPTAEQPRIFGADIPSLSTLPTPAMRTVSPSWELLGSHVN